MKGGWFPTFHQRLALLGLLMVLCAQWFPSLVFAQNPNPGTAPVFDKAVKGQSAAQPEGTLLNVVNWVGNVVSPLLAVGAVVMAIVSYTQGRGVMRWAVTAVGLLMVSGLTRLIESWITSGAGGVQ